MYFLAKYGTQTAFRFPVIKRGAVDFAVSGDWTPASGDTKISKDGGDVANSANNPAIVGGSGAAHWTLTLTATELQAAEVCVQIVDSATKAVEDQFFVIYTYGHASAKIQADLSDPVRLGLTALPNATPAGNGGLPTVDAGNRITGIQGTINNLNNLDAAITTRAPESGGNVAATYAKIINEVYGLEMIRTMIDLIYSDAGQIKLNSDKLDFTGSGPYLVNAQVKGEDNLDFGELKKASLNASTPASIQGDVAGKVLGGGSGTITGTGVRALDDSGKAIAPAATALSNATWTDVLAQVLSGVLLDLIDGGRLDLLIDAIKAKTDNLPASPAATGDIPSPGAIADQVWDEVLNAATHNVPTSAGRRLRQLERAIVSFSGTIAGTPTSTVIPLDAGASEFDDFYKPGIIIVESGLGIQFRRIASYNATEKKVTMATPLIAVPSQGDSVTIMPWATVRVSEIEDNVITADSIQTGAITAIQSGLATGSALSSHDEKLDTVDASLDQVLQKLLEIYDLYGLDPTKPLVVSQTSRQAGSISQSISTVNDVTTVTRT